MTKTNTETLEFVLRDYPYASDGDWNALRVLDAEARIGRAVMLGYSKGLAMSDWKVSFEELEDFLDYIEKGRY